MNKKYIFPKKETENLESIKAYYETIKDFKVLTREEEVELSKRIQSGDESAKNEFICHNLRLVVKTAHAFIGRGIPYPDLVSEGNSGLFRAVEKFDWTKGCKFSTYGSWWIRQKIFRAFEQKSFYGSIPIRTRRVVSRLIDYLERGNSTEQASKKFGIPVKNIEEMLYSTQEPLSLETTTFQEEGGIGYTLSDTIPDETINKDSFIKGITAKTISSNLDMLSKNEKKVIQLRYGIGGKGEYTLEEAGLELGLTRERVRQIQEKAELKLKNNFSLNELWESYKN